MQTISRIGVAALLLVALAAPRGVRSAGSLAGDFQVRSAFVVVDHGVLQLSAHVEYPINDRIRSALRDGVTLAFDLDVTISRHRRLWVDATVLEMTLRRELTLHAVTGRYVLRDEAGVEQESFPTLEAALDQLGRIEEASGAMPILQRADRDLAALETRTRHYFVADAADHLMEGFRRAGFV